MKIADRLVRFVHCIVSKSLSIHLLYMMTWLSIYFIIMMILRASASKVGSTAQVVKTTKTDSYSGIPNLPKLELVRVCCFGGR